MRRKTFTLNLAESNSINEKKLQGEHKLFEWIQILKKKKKYAATQMKLKPMKRELQKLS
jgi:hypothetical protein